MSSVTYKIQGSSSWPIAKQGESSGGREQKNGFTKNKNLQSVLILIWKCTERQRKVWGQGGGEKNNQSCKGQMCTRLLLLVSSSANNLQGLGPEYRSVIRVASKIIVWSLKLITCGKMEHMMMKKCCLSLFQSQWFRDRDTKTARRSTDRTEIFFFFFPNCRRELSQLLQHWWSQRPSALLKDTVHLEAVPWTGL